MIGLHAQIACILEAVARKPGNVHRLQDFPDLTLVDLLLSAAAIAPEIDRAETRSVGQTVLACIEATRRVVSTNTNLGIVLLFAPMAAGPDIESAMANLTVADCRDVYSAIRLANPGGLGRVPRQDVADEPEVTLLEAMRLASDRDLIARQYATGFEDVIAGAERLRASRGQAPEAAVVELQQFFLRRHPDSLIARKRGLAEAAELQLIVKRGEDPGGWFAAEFPRRNPGAVADLVAASLFRALKEGIISMPLTPPWPPYLP
ncbi:MAG: triphosphoribosyl-dephospho-CoA synthase [Gemmataceae bacterium]|nr:triphosphoribosyl-dephospho-CoA synthase [Gemmataceae bacterium]